VPGAPEGDEGKRIARMQGCDFAVWVISIVEVARLAARRSNRDSSREM
jgi:hypothetical protein